MKIIPFGVRKILPALLKGTKDQTIRPAWKEIDVSDGKIQMIGTKVILTTARLEESGIKKAVVSIEKLPRFKEGDEAQLMWMQRSKYKWFRIKDGKGIPNHEVPFKDQPEQRDREVFPKKIREVIVTDVFKIIIWRENNIFFIEFDDGVIREFNSAVIQINSRIKELSKRDGFLHPVQLFQTLDGMYDLRNRKPFWVIRWRRLSL